PRTFLTVNAVAAPTAEEARERALPQLRMFARLRTNKPMIPLETVDEALAAAADPLFDQLTSDVAARWFIGTGDEVAAQLREFATGHGVDEVMLSPVAGAYESEPRDTARGRAQTLELIAAAL